MIEELTVRMARQNPPWGWIRNWGALYKPTAHSQRHEIGRNTINRILVENRIDPAPHRRNKGGGHEGRS